MKKTKIKIMIATHGNLGEALLQACEYFIGKQRDVEVLPLFEDGNIREWKKHVLDQVDLYQDDHILLLTDLLHASTTSNAAFALAYPQVEIISGINLEMLIAAFQLRDTCDLEELAQKIMDMAKADITRIRDQL